MRIIGNPVEIRDGPAAVILSFATGQKEPCRLRLPLFHLNEMGRLPMGRESQKTCLQVGNVPRGQGGITIGRIHGKIGTSWIGYSLIGPGFFVSGPEREHEKGEKWEM